MLGPQDLLKNLVTASTAVVLMGAATASFAVDAVQPAKPAKAAKPAAKVSPAKKPIELADATPEQIEAAKLVYYGKYDCEQKQVVEITENVKSVGYVDVKLGKDQYVMKPVLSSTGAVRLEDVKGETLLVQIANKSMLLNVKAGRRLVDDCVSPKQRELMEVAARAKAAETAAAGAATVPAAAVAK